MVVVYDLSKNNIFILEVLYNTKIKIRQMPVEKIKVFVLTNNLKKEKTNNGTNYQTQTRWP